MEKKSSSLETSALAQMVANYATTGLLVVAAFVIGVLFTEVRYLKNGAPTAAAVAAGAGAQAPAAGDLGVPSAEMAKNVPAVDTKTDHIRGNKNAKTSLVVYTDYECPFCQKYHPTMDQVLEEFGDKIRIVYRHYPLSFHANAHKAAEAAECVAKNAGEDAFWKFTDMYFEKTPATGTGIAVEAMPDLAAEAGANKDAVKKCLDSDEMAQKVDDMMASGTAAGVSGTPGSIIIAEGGKFDFINGALPFEQVKATLAQYIK